MSVSIAAVSCAIFLAPGQRVAVYTEARCPGCHFMLMAVPGSVTVTVHRHTTNGQRKGLGPVVKCRRCSKLCEVETTGSHRIPT